MAACAATHNERRWIAADVFQSLFLHQHYLMCKLLKINRMEVMGLETLILQHAFNATNLPMKWT